MSHFVISSNMGIYTHRLNTCSPETTSSTKSCSVCDLCNMLQDGQGVEGRIPHQISEQTTREKTRQSEHLRTLSVLNITSCLSSSLFTSHPQKLRTFAAPRSQKVEESGTILELISL
eukprot:752854-Hanusia_phi.AAC.2